MKMESIMLNFMCHSASLSNKKKQLFLSLFRDEDAL